MNKYTSKRAFTLVELLVVIAIIAILFVVLISKVDFATDKAKASGVETDFRSIQMAIETVAREHSGFDSLVGENGVGKYDKLEASLNANLDSKLEVSIDDNSGEITFNSAEDPWRESYTGKYYSAMDGQHRGAIVIYSSGADMNLSANSSVFGGAIHTINNNDDYSIGTIYSIIGGKGEIVTTTTGFSTNQEHSQSNVLYGDANGDGLITVEDSNLVQTYCANYDYTTHQSTTAVFPGADANADGKVDLNDAVLILVYLDDNSTVLGPM